MAMVNPLRDAWNRASAAGGLEAWKSRERLCKEMAWAIPDERALEAVAMMSPIVEIGAGTGYWAALLTERGADVVAYDIAPDLAENNWHQGGKKFFDVQLGGPEKAAQHGDRTLFLCWPPYDESCGFESLTAYTGKRVVFIGEGRHGCTGDDRMFEILERDYELTEVLSIPQWFGIRDELHFFERKTTT